MSSWLSSWRLWVNPDERAAAWRYKLIEKLDSVILMATDYAPLK